VAASSRRSSPDTDSRGWRRSTGGDFLPQLLEMTCFARPKRTLFAMQMKECIFHFAFCCWGQSNIAGSCSSIFIPSIVVVTLFSHVLPCFLRQSNRIEQGILLLLCGATRGKALAHQSSKLKMSIVPFSMSTTNYQEPLLVLRLPKSQSPPKFDCLRLSLTAPKA
jgi:hypothetical protein